MGKVIEYGEGGYDPTKPNNNIVNEYETPDVESDIVETINVPVLAVEQLATDMSDPNINSIAEIKSSLSKFLESLKNN